MNINLHPAAIALHKFASTDPHRTNINNIHLTSFTDSATGKAMLRAVATDGHRLTKVEWENTEPGSFLGPILFRGADFKALAKLARKEHATLERKDNGTWLAWVGHASVELRVDAESTFPPYEELFNQLQTGPGCSVALNPKYLVDICNHAKLINKDHVRLRGDMFPKEGLGPLMFTTEGDPSDFYTSAVYIVMPMRA